MSELLKAADVFQSACWHCPAFGRFFGPDVEPNGLRCRYCGKLNEYPNGEHLAVHDAASPT